MNRYAPDGTEAVVGVWASNSVPPAAVGTRVPVGGRNVTSLVFQTGRPARIDSYTDTSGPVGDIAIEVGIRASVGAPISVAGELWGVMIVASRSEPLPAVPRRGWPGSPSWPRPRSRMPRRRPR